MSHCLSTIKEYNNIIKEHFESNHLLDESEIVDMFEDKSDILWKPVDESLKVKIDKEYNKNIVFNDMISWLMLIGAILTLGVGLYLAEGIYKDSVQIKEGFFNTIIVSLILGCLIGGGLWLFLVCISDMFVVKYRLIRHLLNGEYVVTDLNFVSAFKGSTLEGRNGQRSFVRILYNIGLYFFEDSYIPYLYRTIDDAFDCETKLCYTQYKLLKIECESLFHKRHSYYVICGLTE